MVIADEHVMLRDGLRPFWTSCALIDDVIEAGAYQDLFIILTTQAPVHLALVDFNLLGMRWKDSLQRLLTHHNHLKVVILAPSYERSLIREVVGAGVAGVIPKSMSIDTMLSALALIMDGERFVPAAYLADGHAVKTAYPGGAGDEQRISISALTERERTILRLLRDGLSNKGIGRELDLSEVTIKSHLCRIFRKLGVANRVQAANASGHLVDV